MLTPPPPMTRHVLFAVVNRKSLGCMQATHITRQAPTA